MLFINKKKDSKATLSLAFHTSLSWYGLYPRAKWVKVYSQCTFTHRAKGGEKKKENNCHISGATSSALPLMWATNTWAMKMRHGRELTDKTQNAATITLAPRVIGVGEQESEDDSSSLELQRVCFLTWQLSEISILIFLTSADTKKKRERESEQGFDEHVSCGWKCNFTL